MTKPWSRKYRHCRVCKKTDRKHNGKGVCTRCSSKRDYHRNPEPYKRRTRAAYWSNPEKHREAQLNRYYSRYAEHLERSKHDREKRNYDGKREAVLRRDKGRCRVCLKYGNIVHHDDGNGRGHKRPNNKMKNLITVCRACHVRIHKPRLGTGKKK